jgi:hypothetical protein
MKGVKENKGRIARKLQDVMEKIARDVDLSTHFVYNRGWVDSTDNL